MINMAYARVYSKDQDPERQIIKFREIRIEELYIFVEFQSGGF